MSDLRRTVGAQLLDLMPEPVFALDPSGVFLFVNRAAARYLGRPVGDIVGRNVREIFPAEQAERQLEVIRQVVATGEPFVEERITPIGEEKFVFHYAVHRIEGEGGEPVGVLGMVRDVTALVALERCYAELYERATDALFGVDQEGRIRVLNRQAELMSGYTRERLESLHFSRVVPPDEVDRLWQFFQARLAGKEAPTEYEVRYVHASGEERWAEVHISREPSSVGAFQASVRDITERKRLEALRQEFLHIIGHDVKAPLTVIQGFASALRSGLYGDLDREQSQCVERILEASRRVRDLMEQFLLAERLGDGECWPARPGPARGVLESAVAGMEAVARERGVGLVSSCTVDPHAQVGDVEGFKHLLDNLLSNAVKFTPTGGRVEVRLDQDGDTLVLQVRDTGRGIPQGDRERIFERFFRASNAGGAPGSGLGLYIVKRLVERMKGSLDLESAPDEGTRFTVRLPAVRPGSEPPSESE